MPNNNPTQDLIELIRSGCYDIVQQFDGQEEEPYEGCDHNLSIWEM